MSASIAHENVFKFKQIKLANHATSLRFQKDESFDRLVKDHKECIERMGKDDLFNFGAW